MRKEQSLADSCNKLLKNIEEHTKFDNSVVNTLITELARKGRNNNFYNMPQAFEDLKTKVREINNNRYKEYSKTEAMYIGMIYSAILGFDLIKDEKEQRDKLKDNVCKYSEIIGEEITKFEMFKHPGITKTNIKKEGITKKFLKEAVSDGVLDHYMLGRTTKYCFTKNGEDILSIIKKKSKSKA